MESIRVGLKKYAKKMVKKCPKGAAWKLRCQTREKWKVTALANSSLISQEENWRTRDLFFSLKAAQLMEGELARQRVGWSFDVFRSSRYCHRVLRRQKPDESSFFRLLPLFRRRAQRAAVSVAQSAFHSIVRIKTSSYDFYQVGRRLLLSSYFLRWIKRINLCTFII